MRQILSIIFFLVQLSLFSQVAINSTGASADPSAMLDVNSANRGILIPRMTTMQRLTISVPREGLIVYDNETQSFWYRKNSSWVEILNTGNANAWLLAGNSTTDPEEAFIGTTDNQPLIFKTFSMPSGIIHPSGATFLGYQAGMNNVSHTNVGFGRAALGSNTTGWNNTAIGRYALYVNTTGEDNTALGYYSLT